jgi:hypothetical protein
MMRPAIGLTALGLISTAAGVFLPGATDASPWLRLAGGAMLVTAVILFGRAGSKGARGGWVGVAVTTFLLTWILYEALRPAACDAAFGPIGGTNWRTCIYAWGELTGPVLSALTATAVTAAWLAATRRGTRA